MNYYSHHIGDHLIDTAHLSILEDGVYRRLLDRYYTSEQPIAADEDIVFRLLRARSEEEKEAVRTVLREFFTLTDLGWTHQRCEAEIAAYRDKSGKAAVAASKRWNKPKNTDAMPSQCERIADAMLTNNQEPITINQEPKTNNQEPKTNNQEPKTNNQEPKTNNQEPKTNNPKTNPNTEKPLSPAAQARGGGLVYSDAFELAWQDYPERPGANKQEAYKAWNARLKAGVTATDLHAGVQRYRAYVQACQTEPRYIKQPATFFGPDEHFKADWSVQAPAISATAAARNSAHHGFEHIDYYQGVNADGSF